MNGDKRSLLSIRPTAQFRSTSAKGLPVTRQDDETDSGGEDADSGSGTAGEEAARPNWPSRGSAGRDDWGSAKDSERQENGGSRLTERWPVAWMGRVTSRLRDELHRRDGEVVPALV